MNELKRLRLNAGLSVEELADKAKVSAKTVRNIESGRTVPSGSSLIALAGVLEVPAGDLGATLMDSYVTEAA